MEQGPFRSRWLRLLPPIVLLLILWGSRLPALEAFPLHNDEGLHLTRAIEVWRLHPFWEINDGKIINYWLIALFYPQHAPVFVGRIATMFVALIGLAAAYALIDGLFGALPAVLAGLMWIASPYLFLYERFAFSDPEAGALIVLTMLCSVRLARAGRRRDALLTGLALALAALFKLTAAPFALMVALVVAFGRHVAWPRKLTNFIIVAVVVLACFAVPVIYLQLHGGGFGIALGWIVGSQPGRQAAFGANLVRLWEQLIGFGSVAWAMLLGVGLVGMLTSPPNRGVLSEFGEGESRGKYIRLNQLLVIAAFLPLAVIVIFGAEVMPRHFVVALPLALTLGGAGLGLLIERLNHTELRYGAASLITLVLLIGIVPFALQAYADPGDLPLPAAERAQYVTDHSAGFGLREAVIDFPHTVSDHSAEIVASMFPDSCRRAQFYDLMYYNLLCADGQGIKEIRTALAERGSVFVLAEKPPIGLTLSDVDAKATKIAAYPRPGESPETASVTLWRLDR